LNRITRFLRARRVTLRAPYRFVPSYLSRYVIAAIAAAILAPLSIGAMGEAPAMARAAVAKDRESARFTLCASGPRTNCVVDGDTIYYRGTKIRIADIDTPEVSQPRCPAEAQLGAQATRRLHALVNIGPFSLARIDRDEDRFGRKLRILTRGGQSLGGVLVNEGLARWYQGGRRPWC
jgi:micrococcal nuclease